MSGELHDRVVVITGAGGGIGGACVRHVLAAGAKVVGADLDVTTSDLPHDSEHLRLTQVDLLDPSGAQTMIDFALHEFGRVDVLVNNAGVAPVRDSFLTTSDEDWALTLDLNLMGYVRASRAAITAMRRHGDGALVHIASEAARMPNPRLPDYSVSKAAILMLSKVLAAEFTPDGIRSNVVSPAFIRSPIYDRPGGIADSLAAEFGVDKETALAKYVELNKIPVGRLGTVDEVAGIVVYLASTRASFVSGANFCIDGGVTPVV
ncbi:NAD(P)-dependent dehydrogenase (short-subunit alcohol dehydrogenase family) [Rhodococcus wratislaviensis]|uniref:3-oxoacyl-[acyl-carrier-protein] reductase n=3 Tax=Nocardiaceae TaxID=85025 RepID=A0AB38F714_RHOWR|nr:2-hydroxycyclohexanecarboxyl-CoA dehydrogenase [Rhodococcus opacus]REE77404.1 NAD(P)-dependent dehydrogenase (short-subunit alcohol dehydrogenase family) [Rhodococcus wratislaviensis]SPZ35582.1 3-oxoacyl-[acyl-carrier-protein] reductase [Rhodococcus wratislaviensis]